MQCTCPTYGTPDVLPRARIEQMAQRCKHLRALTDAVSASQVEPEGAVKRSRRFWFLQHGEPVEGKWIDGAPINRLERLSFGWSFHRSVDRLIDRDWMTAIRWLFDCSIDWLTDWSIDWLIDWLLQFLVSLPNSRGSSTLCSIQHKRFIASPHPLVLLPLFRPFFNLFFSV